MNQIPDDEMLGKCGESLRHVLDAIPVPVVCLRLDGVLFYTSTELTKLLGYTSADVPNLDVWWPLAYPDEQYRDLVKRTWHGEIDAALRLGRKPSPQEWTVTCKDGSTKKIEFLTAVVEDWILVILRDVTGARRAEEQLRFTQYAVDNMSDFAYWINPDGQFVYVNKAARDRLGYTEDEFLNLTASDMNPDHPPEVWRSHWQELREKKRLSFTANLRTKDGTLVPIEMTANYVEFGGREFNCAVGRDITERKRAEEALRESEERFRTIFDSVNDAIFVHDAQTFAILEVNQRMSEMFGYTRDEAVRSDVGDISSGDPPFDQQHAVELMRRSLEEPQVVEWHCRAKSGDLFWVEANIRRATIRGQKRVLVVVRDVTERKRTEEALRFAQYVIDKLRDAAMWITPDARFSYVNEATTQLLGYTREEMLNMRVPDVNPSFSLDTWNEHWRQTFELKGLVFEASLVTKDGRSLPVEIAVNPVEFEGKEYHCTFLRDITERKTTEEALRLTQFTVDHAADAIFWVDPDARFRYVNDAAARHLGYSRDELLSMSVFDIDLDFTADMWSAHWQDILQHGSVIIETRHRAKDGREIAVEVSANYLEYGGKRYNAAFVRDVTERKAAEEAMRRERALTEAIMDSVPGFLYVQDEQGRFIRWNKVIEAVGGYSSADMQQLRVSKWPWTAGCRKPLMAAVRRVFTEGYAEIDASFIAADGTEKTYHFTGVLMTQDSNNYLVGVAIDVTERKQAEEAAEREAALTRAIFDSAPGILYVMNEQAQFLRWNKRLEKLVGLSDEKLTMMSAADWPWIGDEGSRGLAAIRRVFTDGLADVEASFVAADGSEKTYYFTGSRMIQDHTPYLVGMAIDVTERKQAEEAARQEAALTEAVLGAVPGTLYLFNRDGRLLRWNKRLEELWFFRAKDLHEVDALDWPWVNSDEQRVKEAVERVFTEGYAEAEASFLAEDGSVKTFLFTGVRIEMDHEPYLLGVALDITERKQAEEAAEREAALTRAIFDSVPGPLYVVDEQARFLRWNRRLEETTGFSSTELEQMSAADWPWTGDSGPKAMAAIGRVFTDGYAEVEASFLAIDGAEKTYDFTGIRMTLDDRNYLVGVGIDVTERKRALEDLALTNEELRIMNNLISATAGIADLQSVVNIAADEAVEISGLEGVTVCLIEYGDIFQLAAQRATSAETIAEIEQGVIRIGECLCGMCAKTGMPLILSTKKEVLDYATRESQRGEDIRFHAAFPLMVESKCVGVLCVFTRTDKKPSERRLRLLETACKQVAIAVERAKLFEEVRRNAEELEQRVSDRTAQLETANKELEAFSYSVSHDLRAPLRAIDGFSLVILEDYSDILDDEGKSYLNRIRAAAVRMGVLIDDILRLSRVNRAEMVLTKVNLSDVAASVASDLAESQPERKVEFVIEPNLVVSADASLMRVVLENLIGNAWKFTSREDVARIEVGATREEDRVVYYVRDNGVGFDQAYAGKLFVAFQRLHSDSEFRGTGIGLATVKRVVHRHGGQTWAKGEVGKGATFYFTLEGGQPNASDGHSTR